MHPCGSSFGAAFDGRAGIACSHSSRLLNANRRGRTCHGRANRAHSSCGQSNARQTSHTARLLPDRPLRAMSSARPLPLHQRDGSFGAAIVPPSSPLNANRRGRAYHGRANRAHSSCGQGNARQTSHTARLLPDRPLRAMSSSCPLPLHQRDGSFGKAIVPIIPAQRKSARPNLPRPRQQSALFMRAGQRSPDFAYRALAARPPAPCHAFIVPAAVAST